MHATLTAPRPTPVRADTVQVGDLIATSGTSGGTCWRTVLDVRYVVGIVVLDVADDRGHFVGRWELLRGRMVDRLPS